MMMSDVEIVLAAYPRIHFACRARSMPTPGGRSISDHQVEILSHLDHDDPTMVTELAEQMGVTPSTMSLNLKRLEGAGLVHRARDPADRRVINVRLTDEGRRLGAEHSMLDPDRVYALLRRLPPEPRRRAVHGLALLAESADALVARRGQVVESMEGGP